VDDFYIYYEPDTQASLVGVIKAVAPIELKEMGDMEFIRVPSDIGLGFTRGTTPLTNWVVRWDADADAMCLVQLETDSLREAPKFLEVIPTKEENPQTTITWKPSEGVFNVRTRGVSITHPNLDMNFFVTRECDPNILYYHFSVRLLATMNRVGYDIPCNVSLPKKFSVYTKFELDRYQLRYE